MEQGLTDAWLEAIHWDENGLVPVIAQDHESSRVLMFAWMNRESLQLTVTEQRAIYWSRSRKKLWRKGEESGHVQHLKDIRLDCDNDVILLSVEQIGGIACHTGHERCFFKKLEYQPLSQEPLSQEPGSQAPKRQDVEPVVKDPNEIYS